MVAFLAPVLSALASNGLSVLVEALQAKGKDVIERQLGVKIPEKAEELTPELLAELKTKTMEHEEALIRMANERHAADLAAEGKAAEEVTKRWQADMLSDSYLSKNVRPIALLGTLGFIALCALLSAAGVKIDDAYVLLFKELLGIMVGAYFVGRTVEKGIDVYQGWKQTKGE